MPQRDYAVRSAKKSGLSTTSILLIIIVLLLLAGGGLWFLKSTSPEPNTPVQTTSAPEIKTPELPSKPEMVYSYIRDLETREVLKDSKGDQLSPEQKRLLAQKQKEEEARLAAEQQARIEAENAANKATEQAQTQTSEQVAAANDSEAAKLEEKRKAELKKQEQAKQAEAKKQELAKQKLEKEKQEKAKSETTKAVEPKAAETKTEVAKNDPAKADPAKKTEKAPAKVEKVAGRFGLQCGAFKSKAQAENTQARLAMAGFNARINSSADWNRIIVGPIGDRAAANNALSNASSVAECVIISM